MSEIPCRVSEDLPHYPAKDGETPAHIGEALKKGNPEGTCQTAGPVTTDPKGEAQ